MNSLGLRHLALNVKNAQASKVFYKNFFDMQIEWEPDEKNIFLTTNGHDNLAIHEIAGLGLNPKQQALDHLGFAMLSPADVDEVYQKALAQNVTIIQAPKKHRDGAYSFYMRDLDGYAVQVIHHPPIEKAYKSLCQK
jgi:catechol 2,3-dioxygenase-like lactoylglutathione lyase family enzyme